MKKNLLFCILGGLSFVSGTAHAAPVPGFAAVSAASGKVKQALSASDIPGAQRMIGKPGTFQGVVTQVYAPSGHKMIILDFSKDYKDALTAVALPANAAKFTGAMMLANKRVLISGQFTDYNGRPEIILTDLSQIRLIEK